VSGLSYKQAGVDYDTLDAFKRACQKAAASTRESLKAHNIQETEASRGESAYLLETASEFYAHVEEGLGTKNLVADAMLELTGKSFYRNIGIDTVATITNDLITSGALPISVAMHAAVGDSNWFSQEQRAKDLVEGFAEGCRQSNAVWGGGETPTLQGMVTPSTIILAGSAFGRISPKTKQIRGDVRSGDTMIFLKCLGVQTNGLTLCRKLAERLPKGYLTPLPNGRQYGEALLDPSVIYVRFVKACQDAGISLHYAVHVTGHGWRKLMRLNEPFIYRVTKVPEAPPIFKFIQEHGGLDIREAYGTFNMGIGFAVYVDSKDADTCLSLAKKNGYDAFVGGTVVKDGSRKAVEIEPLGLTFDSDSLQVR
jgi:phosphoribosylformylglycinamidine cyclo-ligase